MATMNIVEEITAKDAKNRFGELLDNVQHSPVRITKNGRGIAMMVSLKEYERYLEADDALWTAHAKEAHEEGEYLGTKESEDLLNELLNVPD